MEEIVELIEPIADGVIILGAAYIGWLFWRTYRRSGDRRSGVLSMIFGAMAAYFTFQVFVLDVIKSEAFEWMESHEALELMLMTMIVALSITLSVRAGWKGSRLTREQDEKKAEKAA